MSTDSVWGRTKSAVDSIGRASANAISGTVDFSKDIATSAISVSLGSVFSISTSMMRSLIAPKDDWLELGIEKRREMLKQPLALRAAATVLGVGFVLALSRGRRLWRFVWVGGSASVVFTPELVWSSQQHAP